MGEHPSGHKPLQTQSERIYIGGLDPPFLKPSDVIQRLKESLPTIAVVQNDVDDTKAYVHVNALALNDEKAFEVISKAYNNVKWKGCRITVQPARPHLLQRLEEERRIREAAKQLASGAAQSASAAAAVQVKVGTPAPEQVPRVAVHVVVHGLGVTNHADAQAGPNGGVRFLTCRGTRASTSTAALTLVVMLGQRHG